ncbi:MAG: hypothetical protein EZS28_017131 [Streblomastix strix]|uniref:Uncharacterized protein n=1 Tax=Streblomastix strix TaxID=222440 RepID=A0A5J4VYB6_9EUKA|nr:MAG: hypothetical protein EZS28_017131 [Streblomastix strix]
MRMLKELNFVSVLLNGFGTGGGSEEENSDVIKYALLNFNTFIYSLQESELIKLQQQMNKEINEQLEEEGGNEEIQFWMFQSMKMNRDESLEAISVYQTTSGITKLFHTGEKILWQNVKSIFNF